MKTERIYRVIRLPGLRPERPTHRVAEGSKGGSNSPLQVGQQPNRGRKAMERIRGDETVAWDSGMCLQKISVRPPSWCIRRKYGHNTFMSIFCTRSKGTLIPQKNLLRFTFSHQNTEKMESENASPRILREPADRLTTLTQRPNVGCPGVHGAVESSGEKKLG